MNTPTKEKIFLGTPICLGIGSGKPFLYKMPQKAISEKSLSDTMVVAEIKRYLEALASAKSEIVALKNRLENEKILEGVAILDSQLQILEDSHFNRTMENKIRTLQKNAEFCLNQVIQELESKFNTLDDPAFRERFKDILDIYQRIVNRLMKNQKTSLANIPSNSVIFADELTPSEIAEANAKHISAFVCRFGSPNSHTAILAKGKGIPFVAGIDVSQMDFTENSIVVVDGRLGHVIIDPLEEVVVQSIRLREMLENQREDLENFNHLHSETYDGHQIKLSMNVENFDELEILGSRYSCGVGLFRTEYMLLKYASFPSEEEQYLHYSEALKKIKGESLVIRTFDLGGDKLFHDLLSSEHHSFLGCRAIRFSLKEKNIFKIQLRAILRASRHGQISILFPMISTLSELIEAKKILEEVKSELTKEEVLFGTSVKIGCMIEVPSAALIADLLAEQCDFLSIGTNDLIQYALAVDRANHFLKDLYSPAHPGVIRLIKMIVMMAQKKNVPVTICGEVAADPRFTALLMGLGVNEFSVSLRSLPMIKNTIRHLNYLSCCRLADKILKLGSASEIQELLNKEYKLNFPDDLLYNN